MMLLNTVNEQMDNAVTAADILWRKRSALDRFILQNYPSIQDAILELIHLSEVAFDGGVVGKIKAVDARREQMSKKRRHETPEACMC
jgi:hypothetical protein